MSAVLWNQVVSDSDTRTDVSHRRAKQPSGARRGSAVSNSAAPLVNSALIESGLGTKLADAATLIRSGDSPSSRNRGRLPVTSSAPAQKSERTSPQEGSRIRTTGSRRKASVKRRRRHGGIAVGRGADADRWSERAVFVGFDSEAGKRWLPMPDWCHVCSSPVRWIAKGESPARAIDTCDPS